MLRGQRVMSSGRESCGKETGERMVVDQESMDRLQLTTCFVINSSFIFISSMAALRLTMAELSSCDRDHRAHKN